MRNYISKIPLGGDKYAFHQNEDFVVLGKELSDEILRRWTPPKIFYHMRNGGHVAALNKHRSSVAFTHLDISRFFYRVSKNKIIKALKKSGFDFLSANQAAAESVVVDGDRKYLPYGFTQSPILASLCLFHSRAGKALMRAPKRLVVSVYVDDIIVSCADPKDARMLEDFSNSLVEKFSEAGFPISDEKKTISQHEITSFNIELSHNKMTIEKWRMDKFLEQIFDGKDNLNVLKGISNYVNSINPAQGAVVDAEIGRIGPP